ncbi:UDP-glucosyl transferase family protein [Pochonia chlamydosporia 170]|uniref:UDP-glucosyl transferase family protein n=1 Tax=Pochonia chlamydosporia 170 TaxID=1380566 RepID=A0A179EX64_METCM|nr:UDP-glucosyl transferase family protein [Pochonia chlamydosporia 170]OAQ57610.1 UDP-glucosyl transferase family protein [Pochonia chlamydosporia 170]
MSNNSNTKNMDTRKLAQPKPGSATLPPQTRQGTRETTHGRQKRILVLVTGGGYTNAAPLFELASILASRGYLIEFGTLSGRDNWLSNWPFVSRFHIIGKAVPPNVEEENYLNMSKWDTDLTSNWASVFKTKLFLESSWPEVYASLKGIVQDHESRPDFILADYWVEAARDVCLEHNIPLAMHWPQMPTAMLHAAYIPGTPGLQIDVLTSEFATIWQRLKNAFAIYTSLPYYLQYRSATKRMRASMGVTRQPKVVSKPDYLCLTNSFFGLEAAKDLPPNVAAIGPVLSDSFVPLTEPLQMFLASRFRVLYISMGTHVLLSHDRLCQILRGSIASLGVGMVDGIIWAIGSKARAQLVQSELIVLPLLDSAKGLGPTSNISETVGGLLNNNHPSILFLEYAPQRAILQDDRIAVFLSHAGPSSANEAAFAGVPLITIPVYFDQIQYAMRLRDAGVSVPLKKETFKAHNVTTAISHIIEDSDRQGPIATNVRRLRSIAQTASRRKYLAADLIEETLADWEGRSIEMRVGVGRSRGMHLQTADTRMGWCKARNLDLWAIVSAATLVLVGVVSAVAVPLVT